MKRSCGSRSWVLVTVVVLALACGDVKAEEASNDNLRSLAGAIAGYRNDNNVWPSSRRQAAEAFGVTHRLANPLTGDDPGYEYVIPGSDIDPYSPQLGDTVILYQLRDGVRDTSLPVAYANGSADSLRRPDAD